MASARLTCCVVALIANRYAIASAETCPPIALVDAPAAIMTALTESLVARGISTSARPTCPAVVVTVSARTTGWVVAIRDAAGRVSERPVADIATAVTLIESWARPDLDGMLLAAHPADAPTSQVVEREEPVVLFTPPIPVVRASPVRLAVDAQSAIGTDGSIWYGVAASACVRFGPTCVGAVARFDQDTTVRGDSETFQTARHAFDLLLALDLPHVHDGWSWTPGVQLGLTFTRSSFDPESGMRPAARIEVDGGSVRTGVHVSADKRIAQHWALGVDVTVDASIFSPADAVDDVARRLAGPPRGFARGAVQLRYEGL